MGRLARITGGYFNAVNAKDLEGVISLFSPSGRVVNHAGVFEGLEGIRSWYSKALDNGFEMIPTCYHETSTSCAVEFEVVGPDSTRKFLDVIEFDNEGRITRLEYFSGSALS